MRIRTRAEPSLILCVCPAVRALWTLVGMVTTYDGPSDVSEHVDRYLADPHHHPSV